ncbi:MAG: ABC transporter ATP-binding protein [Arcobacter butzleri]|jgi:putative ABC transport system ATP-binding protein|nr:ABC transporter ATP-binding protein [Arcobacteraceae bacterium]MDY0364452.1 ABC transporter ATP-binding protein [Arcobacteraceae bacterium]NLO18024.1 ABC transporter ATP-binding protein [Aliarcobacter butzleri]
MIKIENLYKIYETPSKEEQIALDNINLDIEEGECVLLRGHSGSGKSTLLSIIAGILKPSKGFIEVDGAKLSKVPDNFSTIFRRDHIGNIFQKYNLIPDLSVTDNVIAPLIPTDISYQKLIEQGTRAMKIANIYHKKDNLAKNLSGGEQQRCAIARAMVNDPKLILADEPSANLDPELTQQFIQEMHKLKELHKTIIIASHDDILFKSDLFTKVVFLDKGKIYDIN